MSQVCPGCGAAVCDCDLCELQSYKTYKCGTCEGDCQSWACEQIANLKEILGEVRELAEAVEAGSFHIYCSKVKGMSWFDARDELLKRIDEAVG